MKLDERISTENGNPRRPISFLKMEKAILGEATAQERVQLERELARDDGLNEYFAEMKATRSSRDWPHLRRLLPASVSREAGLGTTLAGWLETLLPRPSRSVMAWSAAFAMVLLLVLPVTWVRMQEESGLRSKGGSRPEVNVEVGGVRLAPGQSLHVKNGDILTFSYRSAKPFYSQIWYAEDSGVPSHFEGKEEASLYWPPASSWKKAPQRIRLEGNWKVQRILILASPESAPGADVGRVLSGQEKPKQGSYLFTFDLLQP
ncbi:MAG: hypothetical protein JWO30_285 [Fibrobacteres bacterium]|nr:hypothetical protein [Fibrobacterota bacterium]